jgi:D-tyrosyl-tRNA(Tyr) deacylase
MRVVCQRVRRARVTVEGEVTGEIGAGLLLLVGVSVGDGEAQLRWMAKKCANLRVFPDAEGRNNLSLVDVGGDALAVSQFTLYGDASKGNRPSYIQAAPPEVAEPLYDQFCEVLAGHLGRPVARGRFGAHMEVELLNDGPVTIVLER